MSHDCVNEKGLCKSNSLSLTTFPLLPSVPSENTVRASSVSQIGLWLIVRLGFLHRTSLIILSNGPENKHSSPSFNWLVNFYNKFRSYLLLDYGNKCLPKALFNNRLAAENLKNGTSKVGSKVMD